ENTWVKTLPNVYYYSYATSDTHGAVDVLLRTIQVPNLLTMLLPMQPIGKDSSGTLVVFNGASQKGKWNQMPLLDRLDHLAVVGITLHTQVKDLYFAHAALLASLPPAASTAALSVNSVDSTTAVAPAATVISVTAAVANLKTATASMQTKADLERLCKNPINAFAANYCASMLSNAGARRNLRG
ncbi:hypothetical protein PybrP1_006152, partial [[Pythium] brassicae (nom. inval.)]